MVHHHGAGLHHRERRGPGCAHPGLAGQNAPGPGRERGQGRRQRREKSQIVVDRPPLRFGGEGACLLGIFVPDGHFMVIELLKRKRRLLEFTI